MTKEKLLIFFSVGIGDSLMVTPVLQELQKIKNNFQIDALVMSSPIRDIMKNSSFFDNIHFIDFLKQPILKSMKNIFSIRKEKYDKSILVFPANHFKYRVIHYFLNAKQKFGHIYLERPFPSLDFLHSVTILENGNKHAVEENYRIFEKALNLSFSNYKKLSLKIPTDAKTFAKQYLKNISNCHDKIFRIGIHAGSDQFKNLIHKRWSKNSFAKFIDLLTIKLQDKAPKIAYNKIQFLLFGVGEEVVLNQKIIELCSFPDLCQLVTKTTFLQSAALIQKCNLFISNDSGLMHTASALQIPIITIFGPTSEIFASPWLVEKIIITNNIDCRPCFGYSKKSLKCSRSNKKYKCIEDISAKDVLNQSEPLIDKLLTR